jgi:hypothetical protein
MPACFCTGCSPAGQVADPALITSEPLIVEAAEAAAAAAAGEGFVCASVVTAPFQTRRTLLTLPPLSRRFVYALLVVHSPSTMNCNMRAASELAVTLRTTLSVRASPVRM